MVKRVFNFSKPLLEKVRNTHWKITFNSFLHFYFCLDISIFNFRLLKAVWGNVYITFEKTFCFLEQPLKKVWNISISKIVFTSNWCITFDFRFPKTILNSIEIKRDCNFLKSFLYYQLFKNNFYFSSPI